MEQNYRIRIDHPFTVVAVGHILLFSLAFLYILLSGTSLDIEILKITFIVGVYLLSFYFGTRVDLDLSKFRYPIFFCIVLLSFYGSYTSTRSFLLSIVYTVIISSVAEGYVRYYVRYRERIDFSGIMVFLGVTLFLLSILIKGGIPLLNYDIRKSLTNDPITLITAGSLIYAGVPRFFLVSLPCLILMGYRWYVIILCVAYMLYQYREGKVRLIHFIFLGAILLIFSGFMGKIILSSSKQVWKLNALELIPYRAYFDLKVFDMIVKHEGFLLGKVTFLPLGHVILSKELFGYSHNITSTMFGSLYMDFGMFGVIFSFILGMLSSRLYISLDDNIYSIYAALLLAMCEIGINYAFLVSVLILSYFSLGKSEKG
ncbi:MAG: oligosaccharide repeat unit polymerase [Thermoplasmata archaeon]|nr:MAG: oligosaccharide repeat unit polymerase [Thermoplasmata archaeon]